MPPEGFPSWARALLVIAHPDDEVMFFSTFLHHASSSASSDALHVLCLSTGNDEGLGKTRQDELHKSCHLFGIPSKNIVIIDHPNLQDGMKNDWPTQLIQDVVSAAITDLKPDLVRDSDLFARTERHHFALSHVSAA